jgi:hypothetical protein
MYARVTSYLAWARIDELTERLPAIKQRLEDLEGLIDWSTVWRADGQGLVFSLFDNISWEASLNEVGNIWSGLSGFLKAMPKAENFDNLDTLDG